MAKINTKDRRSGPKTHEGAPAKVIDAEAQLRRSVMSCMLWEDEFYEDGVKIADRIANLCEQVEPNTIAEMAVEARTQQYLRHVPLWLIRALARRVSGNGGQHRGLVTSALVDAIKRPDELTEFLALYWKHGKEPLSAQVKKGLATAFQKFDAYQLAKYNRTDAKITLRDVLFLSHAKPKDDEQAKVWQQLIDDKLPTPNTWEVASSAGKEDKRTMWERMIDTKKIGGMALLRNLRNMEQAGVPDDKVRGAIQSNPFKYVLPFRFVAAAKAAPRFEDVLDGAMLRVLSQQPKLPGKTLVVVDVSGSMNGAPVSRKSDMTRMIAACTLGTICRELCENPVIYATAGSDYTRVHKTALIPARRGMALIDAIAAMCMPLGGGGIFLNPVCRFLAEREKDVDRMIVITDEQDCAINPADSPRHAVPLGKTNYMLNVASAKNGVGYGGKWTHVDGWSENVLKFIAACEG